MWGQLTHRIRVTRHTAVAVEPAAAATTLTVARQPARESVLELSVAGGTGSGEATVSGTADGSAAVEVLRWTAGGVRRTVRAWTAVSGVTTSGLADESPAPTVSGRWLGRDHGPSPVESVLLEDWPAQIDHGTPSWPMGADGRSEGAQARIAIAWADHWAPREGDVLTDDLGDAWEVVGTPRRTGTTMAAVWHCALRRREAR